MLLKQDFDYYFLCQRRIFTSNKLQTWARGYLVFCTKTLTLNSDSV